MEDTDDGKKKETMLYCMYRGPGPAYKLKTGVGTRDHCPSQKQSPAFSIGQRYPEKVEIKPGPHWYDSKITAHGKDHTPSCTMAGRPKQKEVTDSGPGPGDYDVTKTKDGFLSKDHRSPHVSIGVRPKWVDHSPAPPPNTYDVRVKMGEQTQTSLFSPAWSIGGRGETGLKVSNSPGPASYGVPGGDKATTKGFTIQGRTKVKTQGSVSDSPGPNSYNPDLGMANQKKKGFTMGIRHSDFVMPLIKGMDV